MTAFARGSYFSVFSRSSRLMSSGSITIRSVSAGGRGGGALVVPDDAGRAGGRAAASASAFSSSAESAVASGRNQFRCFSIQLRYRSHVHIPCSAPVSMTERIL